MYLFTYFIYLFKTPIERYRDLLPGGQNDQGVKLPIHIDPLPRQKNCGVTPLLPQLGKLFSCLSPRPHTPS